MDEFVVVFVDGADPDMLEVGNGGMTNSEYVVHFSLWAISKVTGSSFLSAFCCRKGILFSEKSEPCSSHRTRPMDACV
jgi:hypothetical protein